MRHYQKHLIAVIVAMACAVPVSANPLRGDLNSGRILEQPGSNLRNRADVQRPSLSSREAIAIAERRYHGRAVGAKRIRTDNGTAYKVRILKRNGKIKNVIIDGE
ncbi:MAG: PepSY domain-containing protein [Spongiibacteraceae bacterium]